MIAALKEAQMALKSGDVPIGAVIVKNGKIIAKAHNQKEKNKNAIEHAEILAISKACKVLKNWHLDQCELYVTVEPCLMCAGAIIQSRIPKLVYGTTNDKFGYINSIESIFDNKNNHKPIIISGVLANECKKIITDFFKEKR